MDAAVERVLQRTGGVRQRFEQAAPAPTDSCLRERLEEAWGWGLLSAPLLQWLAEGSVLDGGSGCEALAGLGSGGQHEGNIHRDLLRLVNPKSPLPSPTLVNVPVWSYKHERVIEEPWPMLLPSHLFQCLSEGFPEVFGDLMNNAREFWSSLRPDDPKLFQHPLHHWHPGWQDRTMPLALHGDAGTYTRVGESVIVVSWASVLQRADTWDTMFLIFAIPKSAVCREGGHDTLHTLFAAVAADLNGLLIMENPVVDHNGNEWEEGTEAAQRAKKGFHGDVRGVLWLLIGDLDWFCNFLHLERHFNGNQPCWLDDCNVTDQPWTDFSLTAAWRGSIMTAEQGQVAISENPLFTLPGVSRFNLCIDTMHTVCLGVAAVITGSALASLLQERPRRQTQKDRLAEIWGDIRGLYRAMEVENRLNNLKITMFLHTGAYAELSARAAEVRGIVPVLAELCRRNSGVSRINLHRHLVLRDLQTFYDVLERNGFQITPADLRILREAVSGCLGHLKVLALNSVRRGELLWALRVKSHFFVHIADHAAFLNPRVGWAYQYENFVQKILRVTRASAKGTPPHKVGTPVMAKYRTVLGTRLQRKRRRDT